MKIETLKYKGSVIEVDCDSDGMGLAIDSKKVATSQPADTSFYMSPLLPYETHEDLMSMGKSIVRKQRTGTVSHLVKS